MNSTKKFPYHWSFGIVTAIAIHAGLCVVPFVRAKETVSKPKPIRISMVTIPSPKPAPKQISKPEPKVVEPPKPKPKPIKPIKKKPLKKRVQKKKPIAKRPPPIKKAKKIPPKPIVKPEPKVEPQPQPVPTPKPVVEKKHEPVKPVVRPSAADMGRYKRGVRKAIQAKMRYPRRARQMNYKGLVIVRITLE